MTAIRQKWSIICSNYLEIPVGKLENNSRERKDKQKAMVQKEQSEKGNNSRKRKDIAIIYRQQTTRES